MDDRNARVLHRNAAISLCRSEIPEKRSEQMEHRETDTGIFLYPQIPNLKIKKKIRLRVASQPGRLGLAIKPQVTSYLAQAHRLGE
jgi:hypothetical protein